MRPPSDYPAFGEPVMAMIDGTVVRASGWRRDHRSRSSLLTVVYMMVEGALRELGGPGFIVGNHVVIRGADGTHAVVAHLQRGSVAVRRGESVRAGEVIGRCGNSGNSSEPHVHAHLMDRASFMFAVGLPMAFRGITLDDEVVDGLPRNEQHLTAPRRLSERV
ncbi:M23 family metallopeptidase [Micrococcales bacterium 31B]|nr:M23 family metallopeptidase [Micrococcales bacterium 31B]